MRLSLGRGPGLRSSAAASATELGARRLRRPRRCCCWPAREQLASTLRRHQPGSAHSSSPFSTKAWSLPVGRALRLRPTRPTACRVSRVPVLDWLCYVPRGQRKFTEGTCHPAPSETSRLARNASANLRRSSAALTRTSLGQHLVNIMFFTTDKGGWRGWLGQDGRDV